MKPGGRRQKGAQYERDLANRWSKSGLFPDAKRGLGQTRAGSDVPDVDNTPFWVEAKRRKRPNILKALEQAEAAVKEVGDPRPPIAVCRWDRMPPGDAVVSMRLRDFEALVRGLIDPDGAVVAGELPTTEVDPRQLVFPHVTTANGPEDAPVSSSGDSR